MAANGINIVAGLAKTSWLKRNENGKYVWQWLMAIANSNNNE
jgi:hypothetical protein